MLTNSRLMPRSAHIGVYLVHAVSCRWWTRESYFPTTPRILFEVITKGSIFWNITQCSLLKVNQHFEGRCRLHLQGRRISQTKTRHGMITALSWFLAWFIFLLWKLSGYVRPKHLLAFNGLHGVMSQRIQLIITTCVKASNPTILLQFVPQDCLQTFENIIRITIFFLLLYCFFTIYIVSEY
jgi:hypothetical protein